MLKEAVFLICILVQRKFNSKSLCAVFVFTFDAAENSTLKKFEMQKVQQLLRRFLGPHFLGDASKCPKDMRMQTTVVEPIYFLCHFWFFQSANGMHARVPG